MEEKFTLIHKQMNSDMKSLHDIYPEVTAGFDVGYGNYHYTGMPVFDSLALSLNGKISLAQPIPVTDVIYSHFYSVSTYFHFEGTGTFRIRKNENIFGKLTKQ